MDPETRERTRRARGDAAGATLGRRLTAEALGTAALLTTVVGSGIMAERLAGGNAALALLANALATGAGLTALLLGLGSVSTHFNPVVTAADAWLGRLPRSEVLPYIAVQLLGAVVGVALAHVMFEAPLFELSRRERSGLAQAVGELAATFVLLTVIQGTARHRPDATPIAVAAYITAAYWFTSSTSFANPAVTLARSLTNTFAGIRPTDVPLFVAAQILGAAAATALMQWLLPAAHAADAATAPPATGRERKEAS